MKNKILSIIVPSYNVENYIDSCVPTYIDKRLFDKVDVYFIDDGATDNTKTKLDKYICEYPNYFHFVHKDNGGHGSVINYGVTNCVKTKYFKIIDGDDYVNADELLNLANYLLNCDGDLVVSCFVHEYPDCSKKQLALLDNQKTFKMGKTYGPEILKSLNITIHSVTFKTSVYVNNAIVLPEKVFYEDNLFVLLPMKYVKSISYVDYCVYHYRLGNPNQSVSFENRNKHFADSVLVKNRALDYLEDIYKTNNKDVIDYSCKKIKDGLACYVGTIFYYKDRKVARQKCLELFEKDSQFPLLIKEMKKSPLLRLAFNTKFRFIFLYKLLLRVRGR